MNRQATAHLNYDQLLQALVDTADLEDAAREHLQVCPGCQTQVARLTQRYDRMGQMAKQLAPAPARVFRIPAQQDAGKHQRFKPVWAMGMVAVLIMAFTIWWPQHIDTPDTPVLQATLDGDIDDPLMDEVDALVADALPAAYQEIASVTESPSVEDLIELIVPAIEEEGGYETHLDHQDAKLEPLASLRFPASAEEGIGSC